MTTVGEGVVLPGELLIGVERLARLTRRVGNVHQGDILVGASDGEAPVGKLDISIGGFE